MIPEYYLFDEIGIGDCRAEPLGRFLAANPGEVTLRINSPGGIATEGAAMVAAIEQHGNVAVQVSGIAASAASLVMVAGRRVSLHRDSMVMIHDPAALAFGTGDQLRKWADTLDKIAGVYAATYARHTGNPVDLIAGWMAAETWMTAEEAKALRFCDAIEGGEAAAPVAAFDYGKFRNAPAHLVQMARKNGWAAGTPVTGKKETQHA